MASFIFDEAAYQLTSTGAGIVFGSATIKVRLTLSSVTPSRTDTVMTGYTGVGTDQTIGSKTVTKDTTNHRIVWDGGDVTFPTVAAGSTVGSLTVYKFVTNDADSVPIWSIDIADTATTGVNITVPWNSAGIAYIQN